MLGTPIETIIETEDRELFSKKLVEINEKLALSYSANSMEEALQVAEKVMDIVASGYGVNARNRLDILCW